jgi:hypothetical protein
MPAFGPFQFRSGSLNGLVHFRMCMIRKLVLNVFDLGRFVRYEVPITPMLIAL